MFKQLDQNFSIHKDLDKLLLAFSEPNLPRPGTRLHLIKTLFCTGNKSSPDPGWSKALWLHARILEKEKGNSTN